MAISESDAPALGLPARGGVCRPFLVKCSLSAMLLLGWRPGPAAAQRDTTVQKPDTAHVTYRTQEIVFLSAGRAAGLSVGDTAEVVSSAGAVLAQAVIVSVAQRTASARLIPTDAPVAVGQLVRFNARAPLVAAAPPPDTAAQAPVAAAPDTGTPPPPRPAAPRAARWRGSVSLDQSVNSVGGAATITSRQTSAAVALTAPLVPWLTLETRSTTRWRNSSTSLSVPGGNSQTMVYQLEARLAPPGSWWNVSLGRFVPADAPGLGYVDGARLEVRPSRSQRLGLVGGFTPDLFTMAPSTAVRRAGAYWAVTTPSLTTSLGGAAEWQGGARRRTWLSAQSYWAASSGLSLSLMADVDYGSGWQSFRGCQLTDLSASLRASLPFGFRGGLGVETSQALRLWALAQMGDTLPMPGRLIGFTGALGRNILGASVDLSASYLKRATDPSPTLRGSLTVFERGFMVVAMGEHGDLFDFGSLLARVPIPLPSARLMAAIGLTASATVLPGSSRTFWRYGVRPEISWRLGGGLFFSASADLGRYAGQSSTFLRAGVSYQLF
jgi:hypothetical protein